ncbi:MAG: hypothetical protein L0312_27575 [Acidobacteria bacterium]|nr:hypothetical protein [Acidobacteriota bacterium]
MASVWLGVPPSKPCGLVRPRDLLWTLDNQAAHVLNRTPSNSTASPTPTNGTPASLSAPRSTRSRSSRSRSTTTRLNALFKNIRILERLNLQFRGEFFNAFNHPNWNQPGRDLGDSNFGIAASARDPRIIQFGLKVLF